VVLMTLVGGLGTLSGPIVGALVIIALENRLGEWGNLLADVTGVEWFRAIGESVTIVIGAIFILCVLAFRKGIVGELIAFSQRLRTRKPASPEPSHTLEKAH
jgi:branched-chain amino acid transport system permease protein